MTHAGQRGAETREERSPGSAEQIAAPTPARNSVAVDVRRILRSMPHVEQHAGEEHASQTDAPKRIFPMRADNPFRDNSYQGPKPAYENPGHHDTRQPAKYIRGKSPLPADAEQAYARAIPLPDNPNTWWAQGAEGIYRYQGNNGRVHWNGGSQFGDTPPAYIVQRLRAR